MPKLYIDEFVGISNRLEVLPLAFALQQAHGHDIVLDWHELDAFTVEGTQRGRVRVLARIGAERVRDCDADRFERLRGKKMILRSLDGPDEKLQPIYLEAGRRVKPKPFVVDAIERTFAPWRGRPVVGVHVRRGDYHLQSAEVYDTTPEWPAVPLWWYAHAMSMILRKQPDVVFFLAGNEDPLALAEITEGLPVFGLDLKSPYGYKGPDHASRASPVGDLFALACCPLLLATPVSGYSHWAANVLGPASDCIVPVPGCTREQPGMGLVQIHGQRLPVWRAAGRSGSHMLPLDGNLTGVDASRQVNTDWMKT